MKLIKKWWKIEEVQKFTPLARSLLLSTRELFIRGNSLNLQIKRSKKSPKEIIELDNQIGEVTRELNEIANEIRNFGFRVEDPVCAIANFPFFTKDDKGVRTGLYFNYSPFDVDALGNPIITWRFNDESTKRPLSELK